MLLMGSKRRKEMGSSIQEHAATAPSEKSRQLMKSMGWTEGTGLGKRRDGITTHIVAKKQKIEQAGLGLEQSKSRQSIQQGEWWKDAVGDTLARLGSKKQSKKKNKQKRFTDEELFEATGGKRFGMRASPSSNLHKWKRTGDSVLDGEDDKAETSEKLSDLAPSKPSQEKDSDPKSNCSKKTKKEKKEKKRSKKSAKT